jgi:hypothetical protein
MPTLAEIYSAINTAKRKGSDFVQNPVTSLQQMVGSANDRARVYNQEMNLAAQGFGAPARGQQATPEQLAAQQSVMDTMANAYNPAGITVFHGSPHLFEKFDTSKIGTGVGQQVYGKGLYLAESPATANEYKVNLSGYSSGAKSALRQNNNNFEEAIAAQNQKLQNYKDLIASGGGGDINRANSFLQLTEKNIQDLEKMRQGVAENKGGLYKVDLPDTHVRRMLDFDAPLKNQPKPVRNLAKSLGMDLNDLGGDLIGKIGKGDEGKKILQDAGIPGVKYYNEMSGGPNQWKRNFVVFDPNHLTILERNQQPINK